MGRTSERIPAGSERGSEEWAGNTRWFVCSRIHFRTTTSLNPRFTGGRAIAGPVAAGLGDMRGRDAVQGTGCARSYARQVLGRPDDTAWTNPGFPISFQVAMKARVGHRARDATIPISPS